MELRVLLQARHRPGVVRLLEGLLQELAAEPGHQGRKSAPARPRARPSCAFYCQAPPPTSSTLFPFADWGELWGIADRTNYDLTQPSGGLRQEPRILRPRDERALHPLRHRAVSGLLTVWRWPSCARPTTSSTWSDAKGKEDVRTVLHLHPAIWHRSSAPCCPCPRSWATRRWRSSNELAKDFMVDYDDAGSIGKRYRRQDEIGTPLLHHRGLPDRRRRQGRGRRLRDRP